MINKSSSTWQSLGWRITRKILFYLIVAITIWFGANFAFYLMNLAETFTFFLGILLLGGIAGGGITFVIREILFFASIKSNTNTNSNETND